MRSFLIPVCLIALGVLAALPFRRVPERSSDPFPAADPWARASAPSVDAPLVTADSPIERPISPVRFASVPQPPSNPYAPLLDNRSESYHEVAIPLALPRDEGNVLDAGQADPRALERFGIPESLLAASGPAAMEPHVGDARHWQVEQPIPALEPASALASVLQQEDPQQEVLGNASRKSSEIIPAATKSPTAKIIEPTAEQPAPSQRKRMFIREPAK